MAKTPGHRDPIAGYRVKGQNGEEMSKGIELGTIGTTNTKTRSNATTTPFFFLENFEKDFSFFYIISDHFRST